MDSLPVRTRGLSGLRRGPALAARRTLAAVGAVVVLLGVAASAGQADALHVMPFPGTPDASPSTQIIFSALAPDQIRAVSVVGSRTGVHIGRLSSLPAGAGTTFAPGTRFAPGERVSVRATLSSPAAGSASGAPGASAIRFSFTV